MKSKGINARGWFYGHSFNGRAELQTAAYVRCPLCGNSGDMVWLATHSHGTNPLEDIDPISGKSTKQNETLDFEN